MTYKIVVMRERHLKFVSAPIATRASSVLFFLHLISSDHLTVS